MKDILYMVGQYIRHHRVKTTILVLSISLIIYLPSGLRVVVNESAESLISRAGSTPLILGAKGSPLELVLNSLYFDTDAPESFPYQEYLRIDESPEITAIPVHTRFRAGEFPIVGTSMDYFHYRNLGVASGENLVFLGDCVIGFRVAERLGMEPGDSLISSPSSVFNLAGAYPLMMNVQGILAPSGTPDDESVFVDLKTAWIMEGLAHGHEDLQQEGLSGSVLEREGDNIIANASVAEYNRVTESNMQSFHFHGDPGEFPITAALVFPGNQRAATLLEGRYLGEEENVHLVDPVEVMEELLGTIIKIQNYMITGIVIIGLSTLATTVLVFMLSLRLRKKEIETMHKIGGARRRIRAILVSEILSVLFMGALISIILTTLTAHFGPAILKGILLGGGA